MPNISDSRLSKLAPHLINTSFKEAVIKYMNELESGSSWLEIAEEVCGNNNQLEKVGLSRLDDLFSESLTVCLKDGVEYNLTRAEIGFFLNSMWTEVRSHVGPKETIDTAKYQKQLYSELFPYKK